MFCCCRRRAFLGGLLLLLILPQLAHKVLLLDAQDVLSGHDDQPEVAVRHVHLDRFGVRAGLLGCFGELLGRGLAVFVGVRQDDVAVLEGGGIQVRSGVVKQHQWRAGSVCSHRISALEFAPEHPLVGRVYPEFPVEYRLEEGLPFGFAHVVFRRGHIAAFQSA